MTTPRGDAMGDVREALILALSAIKDEPDKTGAAEGIRQEIRAAIARIAASNAPSGGGKYETVSSWNMPEGEGWFLAKRPPYEALPVWKRRVPPSEGAGGETREPLDRETLQGVVDRFNALAPDHMQLEVEPEAPAPPASGERERIAHDIKRILNGVFPEEEVRVEAAFLKEVLDAFTLPESKRDLASRAIWGGLETINNLRAEIDRLSHDLNESRKAIELWQNLQRIENKHRDAAESALAESRKEVERSREALKPFAELADHFPRAFDDELIQGRLAGSGRIFLDFCTSGDLRRAREALGEQK